MTTELSKRVDESDRSSEYLSSVADAREAVRKALEAAGLEPEYRVLPNDVPTAVAAAESIGCEVGAIANSLVFTADGEPVMVMASGAHRVDPLLVAPLFGAVKLKRADAETALRATGQHVGGCAPCGHPAPLRIVIDETLRRYAELWVSGGDKATVMRLTFDELVQLTGGQVATIAMHE
jgi:prolyl-tRNA editing enzyme YbaK/EbsC (Cys-tRNA(Pro) deacylase)